MDFRRPLGGLFPGAQAAVLSVLVRTDTPLTGRNVHQLVRPPLSLQSVQVALRDLQRLGVVSTTAAGRAQLHVINRDHYVVAAVEQLASPMTALRRVVEAWGSEVEPTPLAIWLFGSTARGEASASSDIDLLLITGDRSSTAHDRLADVVTSAMGNPCDLLVLHADDLLEMQSDRAPLVSALRAEAVELFGVSPRSFFAPPKKEQR